MDHSGSADAPVLIDFFEVPARRQRFLGRLDARINATADRLFQRSQGVIDERSAAILEQLADELSGYIGSDAAVAATIIQLTDEIDELFAGRGKVSLNPIVRRIRAARRQVARYSIGRAMLRAEFCALGRMLKRADTELMPSATRAHSGSNGERRALSNVFDVVNHFRRSLCIAPQAPPALI